jgi:phenylalanyl-tRNA synthetase beta chain
MKFSFSWLKEHLKTNKSAAEIAEALVELGLEVEELFNPADKFNDFVVGYVESCEKHPDADRLSVCKINDGSLDPVQVICGAPNIRAGLKIAFAKPGAVIPITNEILKKGKIRGLESLGMVCSSKELCMGDDQTGIMELDTDLPAGTSLAQFFNLDDPIFDLSITPNRADCFSVRGIARDLAAKGMGQLIIIDDSEDILPVENNITLAIEDEQACPYFSLLEIKNVENKSSPAWLKKRIEDAGQNSISALVDITNFVMYDLGQPLHAFDADRLAQPFLVGLAQHGEELKALNETVYSLNEDIVVKDKNHVIALAGIKGGFDSGINEDTKNIYLEAAYFSAEYIAKTGQKFNLFSDARARFERGIDPSMTKIALKKAARLIKEICGGVYTNYNEQGTLPKNSRSITVSFNQFEQKTGQKFQKENIQHILEKLGFECVIEDDIFHIKTPPYRHDMVIAENIIEDVLRLQGYGEIPESPLPILRVPTLKSRIQKFKAVLNNRGLDEVYTFSMVSQETAHLFKDENDVVTLSKPLNVELSTLRTSIIPSLLDVVLQNKNKSIDHMGIFEYAPVFFQSLNQNQQNMCLSGVRFHQNHDDNWLQKARLVDVYDVKKDVINVLDVFNISQNSVQIDQENMPSYYHPKRSAKLKQGKKVIAYFGEIHPKILKHFGIKQTCVAFEIFIDDLMPVKDKKLKNFEISIYQPVLRDFAFISDKTLSCEKLLRTIQNIDKKLIRRIDVFDVYEGEKIGLDKKSTALTLHIQADDRTLTDEELMKMQNDIIFACREIGAEIRQGF